MKRGIAGSIVFTIFDRNPLTALSKDTRAIWYYYAKTGDLREPANYSEEVAEQMLDRTGMPLGIEKRPPIYDDQVLPFDITITAQNEYGNAAVKRIYGVEILNSGAGISVDDIVNKPAHLLTLNPAVCWKPLKTSSTPQGDNLVYDTMGNQQGRASGPTWPGSNPPQRPYAGSHLG